MIKRIFYYRNSGLEIFTEIKSYYFNFFSAEIMQGFFSELKEIFQDKYFPINIGKNLMGFIKVNKNFLNKAGYKRYLTKENNFLDFISSYSSKGNTCEMCIFDILIMINILSNRSYIDLFQYPVFPLLYFYDNKKINEKLNRDLKKHIGFQTISEKAKQRKEFFNESFTGQKDELLYGRDQDNEQPFYFNTHYSNVVYTSNYLIRLFPYSFCAIELQGDGFDDPNRLFYSIENTFYNISAQKSDLRETIPEFFYFPEIFININIFYHII